GEGEPVGRHVEHREPEGERELAAECLREAPSLGRRGASRTPEVGLGQRTAGRRHEQGWAAGEDEGRTPADRRGHEASHHRSQGGPAGRSRLQQGTETPAEPRRDRLAEERVADRPLAPDAQPGEEAGEEEARHATREPAERGSGAVGEDRPLQDRLPAVAIGEVAEDHPARGARAERRAEEDGVRLAPEVELGRDGPQQERVEDEIVEVEEPPHPGEGEQAVVHRRWLLVLGEEHRRGNLTDGAPSRPGPGRWRSPGMANGMLAGRVAVVTGAGRGIGRGVAMALAAAGAKVVVNDFGVNVDGTAPSSGPAFDVVKEIERAGGQAAASPESVADWEGARRIIGTALDRYGQLDVLVTCAGILRDRMVFNMSAEEWDAVI